LTANNKKILGENLKALFECFAASGRAFLILKIMNNEQLRDDLIEVYQALREGRIGINEAKQAANIAGKVIGSANSQMEYNKMAQSKEKIKFFENDNY
jgi:hypothetical protein